MKIQQNRINKILIGAITSVGIFFHGALVNASCDAITSNGQCPDLHPTGSEHLDCPTCQTWYAYSPITVYVSGDVLGPCLDPSVINVSVSYTQYDNEVPNNCAIVGTVCRYFPTQKSASCTTTTCEDWCSG
jgi:hypothetical protein